MYEMDEPVRGDLGVSKVEIDPDELDMLRRSDDLLTALMNAGVENWQGWDYAMELYRGMQDVQNLG